MISLSFLNFVDDIVPRVQGEILKIEDSLGSYDDPRLLTLWRFTLFVFFLSFFSRDHAKRRINSSLCAVPAVPHFKSPYRGNLCSNVAFFFLSLSLLASMFFFSLWHGSRVLLLPGTSQLKGFSRKKAKESSELKTTITT